MKSRSKLYLLLVLTISLSLAAFAPQTASGEAETNRPDKIDAALWDVMCASDGDEWIPIEISLYDLDENALFAKLKDKTGLDAEVFRDEARFEKEVALKIREAVEQTIGSGTVQASGNTVRLSDASLGSLKTALSGELEYLFHDALWEELREVEPDRVEDQQIAKSIKTIQAEKNKMLRAEQTAANEAFAALYVEPRNNQVVSVRHYFASILVRAKSEDIRYYAQLEEVAAVFYAPVYQAENALGVIPAQVGADSSTD